MKITVAYIKYVACQNEPSQPMLGEVDLDDPAPGLIKLGLFKSQSMTVLADGVFVIASPVDFDDPKSKMEYITTRAEAGGYFGDVSVALNSAKSQWLFVTFPREHREALLHKLGLPG